jgi:hypothetical protein
MRQEFLLGRGLVQIRATNPTTSNTICQISYTSWKITHPGDNFLYNEELLDGALYLLGPGEEKTLGPIRTLETGCTQQDIANGDVLSTSAENLHAFYWEIKAWEAGSCSPPPPPPPPPPAPLSPALVDCLTPGVISNGILRNGVVNFTVNVGPVELSLVAFKWNGVTFLPQAFVRGEIRTFMPGNHTWAIQPEYPFRQEDLFCGRYPFGEALTDANFDYWAKRTIAGDWGPVTIK